MNQTTFQQMMSNKKKSLYDYSQNQPVLLIFLRHFGCTFCREALDEISKKQKDFERNGVQIIFVHMAEQNTANRYFKRYKIENAVHISDPECVYYQEFGLVKGSLNQLMGLKVWMRGLEAGVIKGHGIGSYIGDGFQMPGVFMIHKGEIADSYIHKQASDKPDYQSLTACCTL